LTSGTASPTIPGALSKQQEAFSSMLGDDGRWTTFLTVEASRVK